MDKSRTDTRVPVPRMEGLTKQFYDWCRKGELRFQRCSRCEALRYVPRELCARCGSFESEWVRVQGNGSVFTYTILARAMHPAFTGAVPYAVAIIELEEGIRLLSKVIDCAPEELHIGMQVYVDFESVNDEVAIPVFRRSCHMMREETTRSPCAL